MKRPWSTIIVLLTTVLIGGGGLAAFALFLYSGPPAWFDFGWGTVSALCWDAALSLLFFIQHSTMLRPGIKKLLRRWISEPYEGCVYGIASGLCLLIVVGFWHPIPVDVVVLTGWGYVLARTCFFLAVVGFIWTARSLGNFDPLGASPLMARLGKPQPAPMNLTISGPYRWVRHPFYFLSMVMIWSYPAPTLDRLMFNVCWTGWIWIGTFLEERDLVNTYGREYRSYQQAVPMLIPFLGRKR